MNKDLSRLSALIILTLLPGIFGSQAPANAENEKHDFPLTKQEIVNTLQRKGVHRKGPLDIASDYESLIKENPTAKALICFDFDSAAIRPESYPLLKEYAKALQEELKGATLIIAGHTDNIGTDAYNLTLSQRRAEAVKSFLVSQCQIDKARLRIQAYGESQPIGSNSSREARALNRRVEFINIY
jgi:outer membrane protein OmpA-like peptidoglycan-associated protein